MIQCKLISNSAKAFLINWWRSHRTRASFSRFKSAVVSRQQELSQ
ncbi:hypothetical protein [Synechocystis sp. PCC 7509]|nr:hypothetical protein [Synechocystis sp. PCC 7509]